MPAGQQQVHRHVDGCHALFQLQHRLWRVGNGQFGCQNPASLGRIMMSIINMDECTFMEYKLQQTSIKKRRCCSSAVWLCPQNLTEEIPEDPISELSSLDETRWTSRCRRRLMFFASAIERLEGVLRVAGMEWGTTWCNCFLCRTKGSQATEGWPRV